MTEAMAGLIWTIIGVYLLAGLLVALYVVVGPLKRLTPDAADVPARVRVLILPGLAALWPLVLARLGGQRGVEDRRPEARS